MKKILSLILLLAMIMSLTVFTACGGSSPAGTDNKPAADENPLPPGIHLSKEIQQNIPKMIAVIDKYLDGGADIDETIASINEFRVNLTFSMGQAHDIASKQNLDNVVMYLKKAKKEELISAPAYVKEITKERNLLASYLELEQR